MIAKTLRTALILSGLALSFGASANAGVYNLVSGVGSPGAPDSSVYVLASQNPTGPFIGSGQFTLSNYTAATIVNANPNWVSAASFDTTSGSNAGWDSTSQNAATSNGTTAYYAVNIGGPGGIGAGLQSATLSGFYSVDDFITAMYINGQLIPGSNLPGYFNQANTLTPINILPFLSANSQNTLFIQDSNTTGPAGIIFDLSVTTSSVPEPSSIAMVSIAGLMGLGAYARRKRSIA